MIKKVTSATPNVADQTYEFPILQKGTDSIAEKINQFLAKDLLDIELGTENENVFENVRATKENIIAVLAYLKYSIEVLNTKIYSVSFFGEGCGAYCEPFERIFTFSLKTGSPIKLADIFTTEGQDKLLDSIIAFKKREVAKKIKEIDKKLADKNLTEQDSNYFSEAKFMYKSCFLNYKSLNHIRYVPLQNGLQIYLGRCSNHAMRALDELGTTTFKLQLNEWQNDLSGLGKELF